MGLSRKCSAFVTICSCWIWLSTQAGPMQRLRGDRMLDRGGRMVERGMKPCCYPEVLEALTWAWAWGGSDSGRSEYKSYFDQTNGFVAFDFISMDREMKFDKIVIQFRPTDASFYAVDRSTRTCCHTTFMESYDQYVMPCMTTDSYCKSKTHVIGSGVNDTMEVLSCFRETSDVTHIRETSAVNCVPVGGIKQDGSTSMILAYEEHSNVLLNISDPSVFHVPPYCSSDYGDCECDPSFLDLIDRFITNRFFKV